MGILLKQLLCFPHSELADGGPPADWVFGEAALGLLHGDHTTGETLKFLIFSEMKLAVGPKDVLY